MSLRSDPLFGGLTRPATIVGVPIEAFVFVFGAVMVIFLLMSIAGMSLQWRIATLGVGGVFYGIARLVCMNDARSFRYVGLQMATKALHQTRGYWRSGSYSPLRGRKRKESVVPAKQKLVNTTKVLTDFVPISSHVTPHNLRTVAGDTLTVIKIDGAAHETADDVDIQSWHDALTGLLMNVAKVSENVAIWTHLVREERNEFPEGDFPEGFSRHLNDKYKASLAGLELMVNTHYLTILVRAPTKMASVFKFGAFKSDRSIRDEIAEVNERIDQMADMIVTSLRRHNARRLGTYVDNAVVFSEPLSLFSLLINGRRSQIAVPKGRAAYSLVQSRVSFGVEQFEVRGPDQLQIGAMLSVNEYQAERTEPGHMNVLLSLPFPFVLTQSFAIFGRTKAIDSLRKQQRLMANAEDSAESQIQAISEALDNVSSSRDVFGEHHLSLDVRANTTRELNECLSEARTALSECGFTVVREDECIEAAFFAQLPGNFRFRPRPAPISSSNLIGFTSFHNYPHGRFDGNQWGSAITLLKSSSGTPYYLNLHVPSSSRPALDETSADERVPGHTLILGPTGAGKTVIQTFVLAQCEKYKPTVFTFDKDQGQEIFIRALGGKYSTVRNGEPTGWNPCTLQDTPSNRLFLEDLVKRCIRGESKTFEFSPTREREIQQAVSGMYGMPFESRSFTAIKAFFSPTDPDGNNARFSKWCLGGSQAWLFDNAIDTIDFSNGRHFGFDVTDFLENDETRTTTVMYLFHRMDQLVDGRRFILNMDEFWKMLLDPYFKKKALDVVKTYRKRNAIAIFGTQSPGDVLQSDISRPLIEQCVTQIYLPNQQASREDYIGGFKLTEREYEHVQRDMIQHRARGFLLKQGMSSTICELNLRGFDDELAVLSGNSSSVLRAHKAMELAGNDPGAWLPVFQRLRKDAA